MSTISPSKQRANDIRLIAVITTFILLAGFLIAGSILFLSRGGKTGRCGQLNAGSLTDLVPRATTSPSFVALGDNCQYWLALRDKKLVAIKPTIASRGDCLVNWKPSTSKWTCGDQPVKLADLDYFHTAYGTGGFKGSWIVDFGDQAAPTT